MVTVNGENMDINGKTVAEFLAESGYNSARIVVEINENIVSKSKYSETKFSDGDTVEIVGFVGGG